MTPWQVLIAELIHCRIIIRFCCWHITLWPWSLTFDLEHLQCIACDVMKLCQIWTQSIYPRRSYCYFNIWPNDFERRVTCFARLWDNFHQVWPSTTYYPCQNYSVFECWYVMSRCDLDLWPVDLESSWYIRRYVIEVLRNLSEIEQSAAELLMFSRYFAHVLWPLDV